MKGQSSESSVNQYVKVRSFLTATLLMIALSTHAVFEGIALGLTNDESGTVNIIVALLCHKAQASMSLGLALSKHFPEADTRAAIILMAFGLATPIGIGIGLYINANNSILEITLSSFAAGTFLYIAASEVVVEEFTILGSRWLKLLFFTLGAGVITAMWTIQ